MSNRETPQRQAIRRVVEQENRPLSPQEILDGAAEAIPGLGLATVYRQVKAGVEQGWLKPVELPGSPVRYEAAGKAHHHHFSCRACGRVFEVEGCPGNLKALTPAGFKLESHDIVLHGLCDACQAA